MLEKNFGSFLFYALGAIRTRDLSLKRGVLYLLSYRRLHNLFNFQFIPARHVEQALVLLYAP